MLASGNHSNMLTFLDFKRILDEQHGLIEVKIQGLGEPFLCNDFIRMVNYASHKDIWVRTTTNATLLDRHENYKRIIDAGVGELQISIDGCSKHIYESIRINADFSKVTRNCMMVNRYCDAVGTDKTRMWVLLQKDNFCELSKFPGFAKELGFKRLTISMDVSSWGGGGWVIKNSEKRVSGDVKQCDIDKLIDNANKLDIDLTFWDITSKYSRENPCPWPFERSYISSDLSIVPCCMIGNPEIANFGDAKKFASIWSGDTYRNFRRVHISGDIPDFCKGCYRQNASEESK